mmetsp:Transcript_6094/g.10724  ORF Transcript_6094/g.10724 Transcript_6094/m.10724 type:complete len:219 (-) Transcript_6094:1051-1707(-)
MPPWTDIGRGIICPIPSTILQQRQRQRTQHICRRTNHPAQRLRIIHPLIPMIARTRILTRRLILQLCPIQLLTIELIPCNGRHLGRDYGRIPLAGRGNKKLHGIIARQNQCPLHAIHANDRLGRKRPRGTLIPHIRIPKEAITIGTHSQNVRRLMHGHVDIVLRNTLRGLSIFIQIDLIEAKVDGSGGGSIELIKVACHRHGEGGGAAESGRGSAADV